MHTAMRCMHELLWALLACDLAHSVTDQPKDITKISKKASITVAIIYRASVHMVGLQNVAIIKIAKLCNAKYCINMNFVTQW